ncbi:MAG TPA: glycoside hydrolase family 15 protein [Pyrinomonadaceae bacterium]
MSSCTALFGQTTNRLAPGAPGIDAHWPSAAKNGFGSSNTLASKVWFTLNNGVMTEVYYPRLDLPNTQALQLIVCSTSACQGESEDMKHELRVLDGRAPSFRQINTDKNNTYTLTKTYATDPQRPSVLIDVRFVSGNRDAYSLYLYYDPSLNNSGMHDTAWSANDALVAADGNVASALVSSGGFEQTTNGFLGTTDGLVQLKGKGRITETYQRAENGNVVQVAKIRKPEAFTLALGFGNSSGEALTNARASLAKGFANVRREYEAGWHAYLKPLRRVEAKYQRQFNMAAMVLKALEDKTYRGATIASPSIPWGGGPNANEPTISGYHAVWSRDLYHVATALLAMGDRAGANRALDYLFNIQQKPDGSFPQNSWVDGRSIGGAVQMDEIAFPLILAYQLRRDDRATWLKHIKPAADFIIRKGPATDQDRWEEKPGYSPATIAAEIAGLVCAAKIAEINRDSSSANAYLKTADDWTGNVEHWTATKGRNREGHYYLRITENDNPDDGAKIEINSSIRVADERAILDAGFLELVRLGIKRADNPLIVESLALIDQLIKVKTPVGEAWYRYNHDAYGERPDGGPYDGRNGLGRLWTLLNGERGEYEIAHRDLVNARKRLDAMMLFANHGRMIPEQVWDRSESPRAEFSFGSGTGSATPLAWSMAQFIRLAINLQENRITETPDVVTRRYRTAVSKR